MSRSFNGTSDRIDFSSPFTPGAITISLWVYCNNITHDGYWYHVHPSGDASPGLFFYLNGSPDAGRVDFGVIGSTTLFRGADTAVSATTWTHFVATWDGTNDYTQMHIYKNGSELSAYDYGQNGASLITANGTHTIGGRANDDNRNFNGLIDGLGSWNVVLSADEITALANGAQPKNIRPASQQIIAPLWGNHSPELNLADQTKNGTLDGTSKGATNAPVQMFTVMPIFVEGGSAGTTYNQSGAGTLTPTGAIIKTGITSKAGTLTPTGAPVKQTTKTFAGALTPSGVLAAIKTAVLSLAGSLTPTGAITKQTGKPAAGSLTPTGATIKTTLKTLVGSLTPSGVLAALKAAFVSISGAITPTGAMTRSTLKGLSGAITPTGTAAKAVYKFFVGTLPSAGALVRGFISGSAIKCDVELTAAVVTNLALTAAVVNNVTLTTAAATNLSLTASTR